MKGFVIPVPAVVTITALDGAYHVEMRPGDVVTFGRSSGCELTFLGDPHLSRRAGCIEHLGPAVAVTNLSTSHSLFVESAGAQRERLLPAHGAAEPPTRLLAAGSYDITSPRWETSQCRILVVITATATNPPDTLTSGDPISTYVALTLNPETKEFATALVLCREKLLDGPTAPVPSVPELTRAVLKATGSQHLLARFDHEPAVYGGGTTASPRPHRSERARLVGRLHDHLKQLREKVHKAGLSPTRELKPHELADVLIENDVITPAHLNLLADPDWLTTQEQLWWRT